MFPCVVRVCSQQSIDFVRGPALGVNSAIQKSGSVDLGSGGRPKPLPREFKPMLASPWTEPPEGPDWIFEVKFDGYRAIAIIEQSKVRLLSGNGLSLEKKFEKVVIRVEESRFGLGNS